MSGGPGGGARRSAVCACVGTVAETVSGVEEAGSCIVGFYSAVLYFFSAGTVFVVLGCTLRYVTLLVGFAILCIIIIRFLCSRVPLTSIFAPVSSFNPS